MNTKSNVYIAVFPDSEVIKIGKADTVFNRARAFKWIGEMDCEGSYEIEVSNNRVFKLERGLQNMLDEFRVDVGNGTGKTEIFKISCLDKALELIKICERSEKIRKGISIPAISDLIKTSVDDKERLRALKLDRQEKIYRQRLVAANKLIRIFEKLHQTIPYQIVGSPSRFIIFSVHVWRDIEKKIEEYFPAIMPDSHSGVPVRIHYSGATIGIIPELIGDGAYIQLSLFSAYHMEKHKHLQPICRELMMLVSRLDNLPKTSVCFKDYFGSA
ncbi:hypothetical protein NBRC116583_02440 [Arenicella sp. 4NH20-0111]|uniref:GIY-YIG nuclease family protein n=1 Tax=Arenicella sp. 4NH20-0111 TaxID=3127648 RepID=UPI003107C295